MRRSSLRRLALVASGAVITSGTLTAVVTPSAFAAGNTVSVSPSSAANDVAQPITVKITTPSGQYAVLPAIQATLVNSHDATDTITGSINTSKTGCASSGPSTSFCADFDLTAADPTKYNLTVSPSSDGNPLDTDTCNQCFTVTNTHTVVVSAATPSSFPQGTAFPSGSTSNVTLSGSNFARGVTLSANAPVGVDNPGSVTFQNVSVDSPTSISAQIAVTNGAYVGTWTITAKNGNGAAGTCACLVVTSKPTITGTSPNPLDIGKGANTDIELDGTGFATGATVAFSASAPTTNTVTVDNVRVESSTKILATVHVPSNEATHDTNPLFSSSRTVTVTNPNGAAATTTATIVKAPTVSSITETHDDGDNGTDNSQLAQGAPARNFTIVGLAFTEDSAGNPRTSVSVTAGNSNVTVSNVVVVDNGDITADIAASAAAPTGAVPITVTTHPDGGTASINLTVTPQPTFTGVSPQTVGGGDSTTLTVSGTHFKAGATVTSDNPDLAFSNVVPAGDGNSLTVDLVVGANPQTGPAKLTVTNLDGGFATCNPACLAVQGIPTFSVLPSSTPNNNGTSTSFTITGSGFTSSPNPPTMTLTPHTALAGQDPIDIAFTSITGGGTQLNGTANLSIAAPVSYDLTVVNGDGKAGTLFDAVQVTDAPVLTLTSMSSHAIAQGQTKTVTLVGDDFSNGMTVDTGLADVHAGAVTVTSPTHATVTLTADPTASTGTFPATLSVTDANGSTTPALEKQEIDVVIPPTLTVDWPAGLQPGGAAKTFDAVVDNTPAGAGGSSYNGRIDFTISGISTLTWSQVNFEYDTGGSVFAPVHQVSDDGAGTLTGWIPPAGGTALAANASQTTHLRVALNSAAPEGTFSIASTYGDVAGASRTDTVATSNDSVDVADVPSVPKSFQALPGNQSALVSWSPPDTDGNSAITGYQVTVSPAPSGGQPDPAAADAVSQTVDGLDNGTQYSFTVVATNAVGDSPSAGPVTATPHVPTTAVTFPAALTAGAAPADVSIGITNDTVTDYPQTRIDITISGLPGLAANRVALIDTTNGGSTPVTLSANGGSLTGSIPNSSTTSLGSESTPTDTLTIQLDQAAPAGTLTFKAELVDASGASDVVLSSDQQSATVVSKTGRLVTFRTPPEIVNSHIGLGLSKGKHGGTNTFTIPSSVPGGAKAVVLDVHVDGPTTGGIVRVFPAGATQANRAVSYVTGQPQDQVTFTAMTNHQVSVRLSAGTAYIKIDLLGYETLSGTTGGQFVSVAPKRVGDTRGATPGTHRIATVTLPSTVPANATAVLVDVTALNTTGSGRMTVYPAGASEPKATAVDFVKGRPHTSAYVTKMSTDRKIVVNIHGSADAIVDLVGYYTPSMTWAGRFRSLVPATVAGVGSSGKSTVTLPSSIPANATSVLFTVRVAGQSGPGLLRTYGAGTKEPTAITLEWGKVAAVSNLVVSRIGAGKKVTFDVQGGSPTVTVELIGYTTG